MNITFLANLLFCWRPLNSDTWKGEFDRQYAFSLSFFFFFCNVYRHLPRRTSVLRHIIKQITLIFKSHICFVWLIIILILSFTFCFYLHLNEYSLFSFYYLICIWQAVRSLFFLLKTKIKAQWFDFESLRN